MKIDLTKLGVKKEKDITVTPFLVRYISEQNKRAIVNSQSLQNLGKKNVKEMTDEQSTDMALTLFEKQIDSVDVMEETLKEVFGLTDKEVDRFLHMEFDKAQEAYQNVMSKVMGADDKKKGEEDPKAK